MFAEKVPTLLSMRDMIHNGLDLSLQDCMIKYAGKRKGLEMENYYLINRWTSEDMPLILYTEMELRAIHRNFEHPSIRATENLLKRAASRLVDAETLSAIKSILEA